MRICYFGTYRDYYSRNRIMISALRTRGHDVIEIHRPFFSRTAEKKNWYALAPLGAFFIYSALFFKAIFSKFDVLIVGYPGHHDIPAAALLSFVKRKPLVFDAFVNISETFVKDRKLIRKKSFSAYLLEIMEKAVLRLPEAVIYDTVENSDYAREKFRIKSAHAVPAGFDENIFRLCEQKRASGTGMKVLHYSYFAPMHGVRYIVEAARILKNNKRFTFHIIGGGQEFGYIREILEKDPIDNVKLSGFTGEEGLYREICSSDICLGVFGGGDKAEKVIPNKIYQCAASGRPVITGESRAVRRVFGEDGGIIFCRPRSGKALADSLQELALHGSMRLEYGKKASRHVRSVFSYDLCGRETEKILESVLKKDKEI